MKNNYIHNGGFKAWDTIKLEKWIFQTDQELEYQFLCKDAHLIAKNVLILRHMILSGGKEFTDETINRVLQLCENENVEGLSILGGEPLHPTNIEGTTKLAKAFKEKMPNKNLWIWSGFLFDRDLKDKEVMKYTDVLVDGQYVDELRNPTLKWKGSENQRVIDVKKSLDSSDIVLYDK